MGERMVKCTVAYNLWVYGAGMRGKVEKKGLFYPGSGGKRGQIEGMSPASRYRLISFLMANTVPGMLPVSFTLTMHKLRDQVEWLKIFERFRVNYTRAGYAGVYRPQLQGNREIDGEHPDELGYHAHLVGWVHPDIGIQHVTEMWLKATGEDCDPYAREHAVHYSLGLSREWVLYLSHIGRHAKQQELPKGMRPWGYINRKQFIDTGSEHKLDRWVFLMMRRVSRRWQEHKLSRRKIIRFRRKRSKERKREGLPKVVRWCESFQMLMPLGMIGDHLIRLFQGPGARPQESVEHEQQRREKYRVLRPWEIDALRA